MENKVGTPRITENITVLAVQLPLVSNIPHRILHFVHLQGLGGVRNRLQEVLVHVLQEVQACAALQLFSWRRQTDDTHADKATKVNYLLRLSPLCLFWEWAQQVFLGAEQ